jgi:hypothetical protein
MGSSTYSDRGTMRGGGEAPRRKVHITEGLRALDVSCGDGITAVQGFMEINLEIKRTESENGSENQLIDGT